MGLLTALIQRARVGAGADRDRRRAPARSGRPATVPEEASLRTDEFLVMLSHELRAPLAAIVGWARVLRSPQSDADAINRALESIERNVRRQTALLDDMVDISRILSGRMELDVRPTELTSLLVQAVQAIRPEASGKAVRLDVVLDPRAGPVPGDPDRLSQVLWSLLSNAVRSSPAGGRVEVLLERRDQVAAIVVKDTGPGIPPELLPHVFEVFRPPGGGPARYQEGLGLSLAIARLITDLHGGAIRADSAGIGRGATFTVSLPVRADGERATRDVGAAPA